MDQALATTAAPATQEYELYGYFKDYALKIAQMKVDYVYVNQNLVNELQALEERYYEIINELAPGQRKIDSETHKFLAQLAEFIGHSTLDYQAVIDQDTNKVYLRGPKMTPPAPQVGEIDPEAGFIPPAKEFKH